MEKHIRLDKMWISQVDSSPRTKCSESGRSVCDCSSIDLSSNGLFALPHPKLFPFCTKLDMSDNEMSRLSSLLPLSKQLTHLNVSRNKLNNISNIISFPMLKDLNLSSNQITEIPNFECTLILLDLSHNRLTHLPPLSSLHNLQTLNLSGNEISDLSEASSFLPISLEFLNISSNKIDVLSSLYHLSFLCDLRSLCISSNSCIIPSIFNHRPFIFALFYKSLVEVDGMPLLEEETILGERMLQDKMSKFKRDGEECCLREYLSVHCPPINSSSHNSSFDARMLKVLEKRREHEMSLSSEFSSTLPSDSRTISVHSPYSNWTRAVFDKDNESVSGISISSTLAPTPNHGIEVVNGEKVETNGMKATPKPKPRMSRDERMKKAVVIIQRWWREKAKRKRTKEREENNGEKRPMKQTIESLIKTANVQAECTEMLERRVNELRERLIAVEALLTPPPPSNLSIVHSEGVARLSWRPPPPVDLYEIYVDGRLEGHVNGRTSSVILSNIPLSASIQLKAVRGSFTSALSKSVLPD
ncbi:hypothetical protein PMAYCL1PPCAC_23880, partial [Pristionchus mayeri]